MKFLTKWQKKRMWRKIKNAFEFEPFYESTKNWNMNIVRHVPGRVNMIQIKLVEFLTCYLFCGIFYLKKKRKKRNNDFGSELGDVWKISWNLNIVATRKNHYYVILAVLKIFVGGIHTCSHDFEISADFSDVSWFTVY